MAITPKRTKITVYFDEGFRTWENTDTVQHTTELVEGHLFIKKQYAVKWLSGREDWSSWVVVHLFAPGTFTEAEFS
jgi:hypothetical protein